jgi:heme exporter protein D
VGYVYAGYGITLATLALYSVRVLRRGRLLSQSLPPKEKTWP